MLSFNHNNHYHIFDLEHNRCMSLYLDICNIPDQLDRDYPCRLNVLEVELEDHKYRLYRHTIRLDEIFRCMPAVNNSRTET